MLIRAPDAEGGKPLGLSWGGGHNSALGEEEPKPHNLICLCKYIEK